MKMLNFFSNVEQFKFLNETLYLFGENRMRIYQPDTAQKFTPKHETDIPYSRFTIDHLDNSLVWSGLTRFNLSTLKFSDALPAYYTPTGHQFGNGDWLVFLADDEVVYFRFSPGTEEIKKIATTYSDGRPIFVKDELVLTIASRAIFAYQNDQLLWQFKISDKSNFLDILGDRFPGTTKDVVVKNDWLYVLAGDLLVGLALSTGRVVWESVGFARYHLMKVIGDELLLTRNVGVTWVDRISGDRITEDLIFEDVITKDGINRSPTGLHPIFVNGSMVHAITNNGRSAVAQFTPKTGALEDFLEFSDLSHVAQLHVSSQNPYGFCLLRSKKLYRFEFSPK